jgi:hypothetical protein
VYGIIRWPRGTVCSQLPSAVNSTVDHPVGSLSLQKTDLLAGGEGVQHGVEAGHGLLAGEFINERRTCLQVERA